MSLDTLEERVQPAAPIDLGVASQFAVLAMPSTVIVTDHASVAGDVGVSQGGLLLTSFGSEITGDVTLSSQNQILGFGQVTGNVAVDSALVQQANADALTASQAAAALAPNQTFTSIRSATTITGNGGLNVIQINGNINASLTLVGGANDVFVINVSGNLDLDRSESLTLSGGVTADNVIYNFVGRRSILQTSSSSQIDGTVLAPSSLAQIRGQVNGEIIAGGVLSLGRGAQVNQVAFSGDPSGGNGGGGSVANASLSGFVFVDVNGDGIKDADETVGLTTTVRLFLLDGFGNYNEVASTTTDTDGHYSFGNLAAGTYSIATDTVESYLVADLVSGSVDGMPTGDANSNISFDNIVLTGTSIGIDYNFGEVLVG